MDQNERKKLEEGLELFLDEGLERLLLSQSLPGAAAAGSVPCF